MHALETMAATKNQAIRISLQVSTPFDIMTKDGSYHPAEAHNLVTNLPESSGLFLLSPFIVFCKHRDAA
jgi:hypothetical protein